MSDDAKPLSDEERSELEALRAEKERRERAAKAAADRDELERLRRQQAQAEADAAEDARIREIQRRTHDLVEPDDDLRMPLMQKVVLVALVVGVIIFIAFQLLK
jgi:multidrug efflux pump subunit AcrA (membrane-fusion protein)